MRYPELTIRIGIEMDYYPNLETELATKHDSYAQLIVDTFDLVLCSIHDINGGSFSNKKIAPGIFKDRDINMFYREYFELETRAVQFRLFDVIVHPDLIKKFPTSLPLV